MRDEARPSKFPMVGGLFWVIKILATTLGESISNFVAISPLNWGYALSSALFIGLFAISLIAQLKAGHFHPFVFWSVILTTSIVGTSLSDFMNRTAGLGYAGGATVLTAALAVVLIIWRFSGQTMNVEQIDTFKGEVLYWIATLVSNTLGTSSGDFLSDYLGIGFRGSSTIIIAAMLLILAGHYLTTINGTILFWIAYVLTRPLGAVAENAVEKPAIQGGAGVGTTATSLVLLASLLAGVIYQTFTHRQQTRALTPAGTSESQQRPAHPVLKPESGPDP